MLSENAENPLMKRLRVVILDFGADEAVVAKLPKRVSQKFETSEGLHKISSFIV
jgi:hypothetical protein